MSQFLGVLYPFRWAAFEVLSLTGVYISQGCCNKLPKWLKRTDIAGLSIEKTFHHYVDMNVCTWLLLLQVFSHLPHFLKEDSHSSHCNRIRNCHSFKIENLFCTISLGYLDITYELPKWIKQRNKVTYLLTFELQKLRTLNKTIELDKYFLIQNFSFNSRDENSMTWREREKL